MAISRSVKAAVLAAAGFAMSLGVATVPVASAAQAAPARPALGLPYVCRVGGHAPCWAGLQHPPVEYYGHSGGQMRVASGDLALITCYYYGSPVVHGDNIEDHVTELLTTAGYYQTVNGHIPDWNVDLSDHNPWQVGVPPC